MGMAKLDEVVGGKDILGRPAWCEHDKADMFLSESPCNVLGGSEIEKERNGGTQRSPGLVVRCLSQPGLEATWMLPE